MGEAWTHDDDVKLRRQRGSGASNARIAELMGRSLRAVEARASRLGIKTRRRRWTADEDAAIERMRAEGKTAQEIAAQIGRTRVAVERRAQCLGLEHVKRAWTVAERRRLVALYEQGLSRDEIAAQLNRTTVAIKDALDIEINPRERLHLRRWAAWEDRVIRGGWSEQTDAQLAAALGRTAAAVKARRCKLGLHRG